MERVKGIEPSSGYSEVPQHQQSSDSAPLDHTQIRAQVADSASPDLAKVVAAWEKLPAALKNAILAIVNSTEAAP
jgi:hypothetical protein